MYISIDYWFEVRDLSNPPMTDDNSLNSFLLRLSEGCRSAQLETVIWVEELPENMELHFPPNGECGGEPDLLFQMYPEERVAGTEDEYSTAGTIILDTWADVITEVTRLTTCYNFHLFKEFELM